MTVFRRTSIHAPRSGGGFTLLELTIVVAVMLLLLTVALVASLDWGRSHAMRGAVRQMRAALGLARQTAITRSAHAHFHFGNTLPPAPIRGYYTIRDEEGDLENTNHFSRGVVFRFDDGAVADTVSFRADGAGAGPEADWPGGYRELVLWEDARGTNGLIVTVRVSRITGTTEVLE